MSETTKEFALILNRLILSNPDLPRNYITELAKRMGFTKWKLYKLLNPEADYPVTVSDFICLYLNIDGLLLEALKYIVNECDPKLALINIAGNGNGSIIDDIEDIDIFEGRFVEDKRKALADGNLDKDERAKLKDDVVRIIEACKNLIEDINHYGEKPETGVKKYNKTKQVLSMEK